MTLHFTEKDQDQFEADMRQVHFNSSFGFLNAHNGFRRGCIHLIIGTTGGGKSTLVRSILRDLILQKDNDAVISVWLSEEEVDEYRAQFALGMPSDERLLKTQAYSELSMPDKSEMRFFEWIEFYQPDVLIFDNITTSCYYMDLFPKDQAKFVTKVKEITKRLNIATVLIAHTDAKSTDNSDRVLTVNDIRGSKTVANMAEFAYILQRFEVGKAFYPTLRIAKSRSQNLVHALYYLKYDPKFRSYMQDSPINFEEFKEVYGKRNKLR